MVIPYRTLLHATEFIEPTTVVTGLRYTTGMLNGFNNVTFMYDPEWSYESGNPTYPISFFHVKNMNEIMQSEISQKTMLFYNSSDTKEGTQGGLTNVISDNIVIKPKAYRLDIIIPANSSTFESNPYMNAETNANALNLVTGLTDFSSNYTSTWKDTVLNKSGANWYFGTLIGMNGKIVSHSYSLISTLIKALYGLGTDNTVSVMNILSSQNDFNKASLEYMWRNRRILKLKMWNGWKFKYVAIQNLEITKTGENGDFYEGTLTVQEVPILTFKKQSSKTSLSYLEKFSSKLGTVQKKAVDTFIKAMSTSYSSLTKK